MAESPGVSSAEDAGPLYCACGQAKLAMVKDPVPGVHYCLFGHCAAPEPVRGSASAP